ncbi:MAG: hypothetical protein M1839_009234 [Geoglossum umbratile]|nr:MAG: hypothetical protein M1839_009234 [Geoglossum umbratile]
MAQAERELRRRITGNVSLYLFLDRHRQRSFLRRNIEKALRFHAERERSSGHAVLPSNGAPVAHPIPVDERGRGLLDREMDVVMAENIPTSVATIHGEAKTHKRGEALDGIVGKIRPHDTEDSLPESVLKIEVRSLKRKRVGNEQDSKSAERPVPKRMKSMLASCRCELQILGQSLHDDSMELLIQDRQCCNVRRVLGGDEDTVAEIELAEGAFFVRTNRLLDEVRRGSKLVQTRRSRYTVKISLISTEPSNWLPELMAEPSPSHARSRHPVHLISASGNLCFPRGGVLLDTWPASSTGSLNKKTTEFGMEVTVSASNLMPQKLRKTAARKPSSDIERNPAPKAQVKYLIGATKTQKLMGYCCNMCERREFPSIEFLHFHLLTCHDYFKYKISEGRSQEGTTRWKIHLDIADYRSFDDDDDEDEKVVWVRPNRPFRLSKYLRGDDSWVTGKTPPPTPPPAPPQLSRSTSSGRNSQTRQAPGSSIAIDSNTVPDLPEPKSRKFAVPPGGRYFRSLTKRRLKQGEMLSESDDDVDELWLIQKHKETIDDFADVFLAEKTFMKRFDEHMLRENLCAQRYVPSALIRFCRSNREWLNATDMLVEFWKQCLYLTQHGIINAVHVKTCMDIIQGGGDAGRSKVRLGADLPKRAMGAHEDLPPAPKVRQPVVQRRSVHDPLSSEMDIDDSLGTDEERIVRTIVHGDVQPQVPIRTLPPPARQQHESSTSINAGHVGYAVGEYINTELCYGGCGEWKKSDLIICEERTCDKRFWHLSCVGLEKRIPNWRCHVCLTRARMTMTALPSQILTYPV